MDSGDDRLFFLFQKKINLALFVQKEREEYEVVIEDGKFMFKNSRQILNTSGGSRDAKWIFVLSTSKNLYVGQVICSYHHTTSTMQ